MVCTVVISREDDAYIAKDLKTNIADQGDTVEEALANLKEALELYYEDVDIDSEDKSSVLYTTSLEVMV